MVRGTGAIMPLYEDDIRRLAERFDAPPVRPYGANSICALLALLIYGEARGEPYEGRVAVAQVAANRAKRPKWRWGEVGLSWRSNLKRVILQPNQFSCFNDGDRSLETLPDADNEVWRECKAIALGVMLELLPDYSHEANHHHAEGVMPSWAGGETPVAHIGAHFFYEL